MNKRAMSDVVAVVIIVAMSIVAASLLSLFIIKLVNNGTISLSDTGLSIRDVEAYYNNHIVSSHIINANESTETVFVSVERGADKSNLTGLKFVFTIDGNSQSCERTSVPNTLETSVYAFKSSLFAKKPEKIEVIPIIKVGKSEKVSKTGFGATIFETEKRFIEKIDECGGFCCGTNDVLPTNPKLP